MRKWAYLLSVLMCLAILGGCGKKDMETSQEAVKQNKDYVYSFESFNEKLEGHDLSQNIILQDRMIFIEYRYEDVAPQAREEGAVMEDVPEEELAAAEAVITEEAVVEEAGVEEAVAVEDMAVDMPVDDFYEEEFMDMKEYLCVLQCDMEGNILSEFEVEMPSEGGIHGMSADEAGNIYLALCEYGKDTSDPEMVKDLYTLLVYSETGEELNRAELGKDCPPEEYYYVNNIICDKDKIFLWTTNGIEIYNQDLTLSKTVTMENQEAASVYMLRDGRLAVQFYGDRNQYFRTLDVESGEFSEKIEVTYASYNYSNYAGLTSDFLLVDSIGIYTYNLGDEAPVKIMDFVDSDMTSNTCYSLTQLSEDSFFGWTYDEASGMDMCGIFRKVAPENIPDKKVLTLGTQWLDYDVRNRVVEFNKNSDEYRICVEDYNQYNTSEDYTLGATKLNTDIAAGKAPDILCLTGDMPIDSYMSKGLFADLNTFIENDPEIKIEDYMPEIIEAFSYEGKWYQLVPNYNLFTVFGKTAEVGEEPGWTFDEMEALKAQKGADVQMFSEQTKSSIIMYSMMLNSDSYINWETGECYFNTDEFIQLLEFANEFPSEINYEELYNNPNYWETQETVYRDGRALLMPYTLANFEDFRYAEQGIYGEQITAIGFPVNEGIGNAYSCSTNFAISAKSKNQEAAWEFLRYYLTDEYQDDLEYGWPIKLSSLDKLVAKAQEKPYYEDENGNKVEYDETYYLNGVEIKLNTMTQEDCDRVISFLKSADHVQSYNNSIMTILDEECAAYFEGQKSAKEVADIIQSRIYIYVNENM